MACRFLSVVLPAVLLGCNALVAPPSQQFRAVSRKKLLGQEDGPWSAVEQDEGTDRNICNYYKQLPDFYVIGQQKCGTSSIAQDMMEAGVANVHGPQNDKEFHFFDAVTRLDYSLVGHDGTMRNRAAWREWMPECPRATKDDEGKWHKARRTVLADFTPGYSSLIPRPENFEPTGPWLRAYDVPANVPLKMREMYGDFASDKLQFVLMMREPLSQMQSAWYHAQSFDFHNVCSSCKADSFRDALQASISGLQNARPQFTQWVWNVMYGRHLEEWLQHFKASQFYMIPTNVYSKGNNTAICEDLSRRLEFGMACGEQKGGDSETTHAWTHEHPSLEEDAGGLRDSFMDVLMAKENDRLVSLLALAHNDGMGLANYKGSRGNKEEIKAWLEAGW